MRLFLIKRFFFVKLNQISDYPLGNQIDVIVVIKDPGENAQITLKSGEIKSKRNLHVFDESMTAIEIVIFFFIIKKFKKI